jgi:hypothetical protein
MRDSLVVALHRAALDCDGKPTKRLMVVAERLVKSAEEGDVAAIKEIFDRVDGKVAQRVEGPNGGPVQFQDVTEDRAPLLDMIIAARLASKPAETRH